MKFLIVLILLLNAVLFSFSENKQLFFDLDQTISDKGRYEIEKELQIETLKSRFNQTARMNDQLSYMFSEQLYEAYFTFNYDSAMVYVLKMIDHAEKNQHHFNLSKSRISLSKTFLAAGIFNEAKETLESVDTKVLTDSLKMEYYFTFSRLYFDMIDYYQKTYFTQDYNQLGLQYIDSALALTPLNSARFYSFNGLKLVRMHRYADALLNYQSLFDQFELEGRQFAIESSTYGFVLEQNGMIDEGIDWLIKAAVVDIKLANKENVALLNLANKLFANGDIEKASEYLQVALADAKTYGAFQRNSQIMQVQPIVEAARLHLADQQRKRIQRYAFMVSFLLIAIVIILVLLFQQFRNVRNARDLINKKNNELTSVNKKLREANLIKQEYIGNFFKTNSDLIEKLDGYRQTIENKVTTHKTDDLISLISSQNIKEEREKMFRTFDAVFLNIFPDFVEKFNLLFTPPDQMELKYDAQMNTDLRIFALIRLGITDNEKIAHILDYSVHTINTYKTKIKNRSIVSNDDFEKEIMKIQSI